MTEEKTEILPKLHPVHQKLAKGLAEQHSNEFIKLTPEEILKRGAEERYGEKGLQKIAEKIKDPKSREIIEGE